MKFLSYFLLLICVSKGGDSLQVPHWVSGVSVANFKKSSPPVGSAAQPDYNQWGEQCGANPHLTIEKDFKECVDDIYGSLYTGTEEFTKSGEMCSPWTAQDLSGDTGSALESNFCRNNGQDYLWCRKARKPGWEVCDVWTCTQKQSMGFWGTFVQKTPRKNRWNPKKPTQPTTTKPSISRKRKKPIKSSKKQPKLPKVSYIRGGKEVIPHNGWASYVLFSYTKPNGRLQDCAATVIHKQWAITAAHCFTKIGAGASIKHFDHPEFAQRPDDHHYEFDVSLIKIDKPVDPKVIPFCLPNLFDPKFETRVGTRNNAHIYYSNCVIAGRGSTKNQDPSLEPFKEAYFNVLADDIRVHDMKVDGSPTIDKQIWVQHPHGDKGLLNGDSGGPFVCWNRFREAWILMGVSSISADKGRSM